MSGRPTIRTLADLNRRPTSSDGSDDSDNPQEYYTGGEKSGMIVQDPTRGRGNNTDDIFDQARQMGAMPGPHVPPPSSSSSSSFAGIGRLLSSEETTAPPPPPVRQVPAERLVHTIIFWNNGFTVDEGPLRRFDDPENASFLESIRRQECPLELEPSDRRTEVNVNLTRAQKDYVEPVGPKNLFQGVGRTLGSSSEETPPVQTPHDTSSSATPIGLSVDESQPITTVQLRLADGTRIVARFNTSHTVGHIRGFIDASRPGAARNYQLQTGFPPKILSDASSTIDQAGLGNSVIIQKI